MSVPRTLEWRGDAAGHLEVLDQRALPGERRTLRCERPADVYEAIKTLAVRGAPAIGVAAAYGIVLGLRGRTFARTEDLARAVDETAAYLVESRPTAVNLAWACARMRRRAAACVAEGLAPERARERVLEEARAIEAEDAAMCRAIGEAGAPLVRDGAGVLTHCNAGALATAGIGTALGVLYVAKEKGTRFRVYAGETRPLLQGARLTAWELSESGVDVTLVCDAMTAALFARGAVDMVIVGADRIARNGDTANKIGTYGLACLAKAHGVPFYVAAPSSTFDLAIASGKEVPIEERAPDEVKGFGPARTAPERVAVWNPAFDVTPAGLIAGIVTEMGVIAPVTEENVVAMIGSAGR